MKINPDCVRDILIHIESFEYGSAHTIEQMCSELPRYSYEELDYHCLHLYDAGFIKATTVNIRGGYLPQVSRVFDLTYQGHQFLDDCQKHWFFFSQYSFNNRHRSYYISCSKEPWPTVT